MTDRMLIAGVGNIFLGDDGFGSEVVGRAARPQPAFRRALQAARHRLQRA